MPSRIRGVTPRRRTRVIMNYPVPNITTPSFSLKRQYDEIAPVKNSKNVDVKFTPGTGWMLEQYHETAHERPVVAAEVLALETVHRRKYADSGEREAAKKEIRAANQRKRWDKIFSEEGIDESVFESEMEEYKSADAGFKVVIEDIYDDFNARIETARNNFRIL